MNYLLGVLGDVVPYIGSLIREDVSFRGIGMALLEYTVV